MSCFFFELKRWLRHPEFMAFWLLITVLAGVITWFDPSRNAGMAIYAPLFAIYLAAGDTVQGLRRAHWDFLVSRGPSLEFWLAIRFLLAVSAASLTLAADMGLAVISGSVRLEEALGWLNAVAYWAAVGVAMGFWLSGGGTVAFSLLTTFFSVWWSNSGCLRLTGVPAEKLPWLSKGIWTFFFIGPTTKLFDYLELGSWWWEALRLCAGLAVALLALRYASRRPLPA